MSKYTTELRYYLQTLAKTEDEENVTDILEKSWNLVFNFDFPIYDEKHRQELCTKILLHYYFREIGTETIGAWHIKLQMKMNEIMPYYNKLYQVLDENFSLSKTRESFRTLEHTGKNDFTGNVNTVNTNSSNVNNMDNTVNKFLDTPQGGLDGILDTDYLTNATINDVNSTQNITNNSSGDTSTKNLNNDEYSDNEHKYGNFDILENVEKYNSEKFNIDLAIINELNSLFMKLW